MARLLVLLIGIVIAVSAAALEPYAVVNVPVANLREEPRHGSELISQGIMGTPLEVKSRDGEWLTVRMPDGYEGYMIDNSVVLMDKETFRKWTSSPRAVVIAQATELLKYPDSVAEVVSPLQLADIVAVTDTVDSGRWLHVSLPDGRDGFLPETHLAGFRPFGSTASTLSPGQRADSVIARGLRLLGQEYLWGGTSVKANDCSGFTRILFQAVGTYLPRDAWQQALAGEPVTKEDLLPGDLVFFANAKGRVNHVGIYIGDGQMLHCSGRVRLHRIFNTSGNSDNLPMYPKSPFAFRRVLTPAPLESDIKANILYFNL